LVEVSQVASSLAVEFMGKQDGKDGKRPDDWACIVCANALLAGKKVYVNPKYYREELIGHGSKKACKHGHPKGTSHLCAWHDVEEKFRQRQANRPTPVAVPKGQGKGQTNDADKKVTGAEQEVGGGESQEGRGT